MHDASNLAEHYVSVILGLNDFVAEHLAAIGDHSQDRFLEGVRRAAERLVNALQGGTDATRATPLRPADSGMPTVLLVEDDPGNQLLIRTLLRRRFAVLLASNGEELREQLEAHGDQIGVVLMDISLRGSEDGLALTRRLRRDARFAGLPVIAVTAYALEHDRATALAAGCDEYVTKPIDSRDLLAKMRKLLRDRSALVSAEVA